MKKLLTLTLAIAISVCALALTANATFDKTRTYNGQFTDVNEGSWYAQSVKTCYEMGLINGQSENAFNPQGMFTVAQAATVAARMHNIYNGGNGNIPTGSGKWYSGAVDYCIKNGIFEKDEFSDYERFITRAEMAGIMVAALPKSEWEAINNVKELPDVENNGGKNENAIFTFYNAGILAGSDEYGKFQPHAAITRAEVAALIVRMADADERLTVNLTPLSERPAVILPGYCKEVTSNGRIIFRDDNNNYGIMTVDGNIIVPAKYHGIYPLENGKFKLISCDENYKTEISDSDGKILYTYDGFADHFADDYYFANNTLYNGNTVIAEEINEVSACEDYFIFGKNGYYAVADKTGKIILDYAYGEISVYEDYFIRREKYSKYDYTYTFYDKSGKLLCSGKYENISPKGLIVYRENGKEGLATPYGKVVEALYDDVYIYSNSSFAILKYGTMEALAGANGIIFDLGKYASFGIAGDYAVAKREGGLDLVDITGDIVASIDGNYLTTDVAVANTLIRFGYAEYSTDGYSKHTYNVAYDTESKQILKYDAVAVGNWAGHSVSYYANEEKCFLSDGTEIAEVFRFTDDNDSNHIIYKSIDGKYGINTANMIYNSPEEAVEYKPCYKIGEENGKPVVTYGDEVVIQYYKAPFYYDSITALGYNNYYICTFNGVNYLLHP